MSVDAHCHIDLHSDPSAIVDSAIAAGLRVVAVTTTPAAFKISSTFSDESKGIVPALGMHPEVVGTRPKDISLFSKYLEKVTWVGEVGLDGSKRFRNSWNTQISVFDQVLRECSDAGGRILSIHSRSASSKVVEMLTNYRHAGTPVFHWYSGRLGDIEAALNLGSYFSVNAKMLSSKSGLAVAKRIPIERLLTESDAPFACDSKNDSIADQILECERRLAYVLNSDPKEIQENVLKNFERITS